MRLIDFGKLLRPAGFYRTALFVIAVFLSIALFEGVALTAAAAKDDLPPNIPTAQEIAALIGGGNVVAKATSASPLDIECTYEHARDLDGSRSKNSAILSVTGYPDPTQARKVFDDYVSSSVGSLLDTQSLGSIRPGCQKIC